MKAGMYHVYILLGREGDLAKICSATCECAAGYDSAFFTFMVNILPSIFYCRKSASCTHISAVLHTLCALAPATFPVQATSALDEGDNDEVPVTSLPCQWKAPKKERRVCYRYQRPDLKSMIMPIQ